MIETKCEVCRSFLDAEDLFCCNCGTENPNGQDASGVSLKPQRPSDSSMGVTSFQCEQCGASMSYDPSARQLRCPFCGGEKLQPKRSTRQLRPSAVVPFQVTRPEVEPLLRKWLGTGFWRPGDAAEVSVIAKAEQVYVPYWVFSANVETAWTADTSAVPAGARGDWYPVSGTTNRKYGQILVCASGILFPIEAREIAPFDLSKSVSPDKVDLVHAIVEEFRVTKRDARGVARGEIDRIVSGEVQQQVRGRTRNIRVNNRIQDMTSRPVLLPVWIMAYHYQEKPYRVLVNGQTREIYGAAPFSNAKLAIVIVAAFAIVLFIIAIVVLGSLVAHHQ